MTSYDQIQISYTANFLLHVLKHRTNSLTILRVIILT